MIPFDLRVKNYIGFVVPEENKDCLGEMRHFELSPVDYNKKSGRYLMHIPELMPFIMEDCGIWCFNGLNSLQVANNMKTDDRPYSEDVKIIAHVKYMKESTFVGNKDSMNGSYIPLLPGVKFLIQFLDNDINSGQIIRQIPHDIEFRLTDMGG